jgi:hypothetical protein
VGDGSIAEPVLDALLEANRGYLPRFFDRPEAAVVSRD